MMLRPSSLRGMNRRQILKAFGATAATVLSVPAGVRTALADPIFLDYPFQLGVASGDPLPDGVVLWTRLAPRPLEVGSGMPKAAVEVEWQIAEDERFSQGVQKGTAVARPELGHAVHVEVAGLKPGRPYWYRFTAGRERSPVGRTRTLPAAGAALDRVRFAVCGCQDFEQGLYTAYRHLSREDVQFIYHYGDYIYEYRTRRTHRSWHAGEPVPATREHLGDEIYSLDDYRRRYAQYKMDLDLQLAHAAAPWFMSWDDHEVDNNWVSNFDQDDVPPEVFLLRRVAAAQAYYENMPLRRTSFPQGPSIQIYRRAVLGDLMTLNILDTRQFRTDQPCDDRWGVPICDGADDPAAQVLGDAQEKWLFKGLDQSTTRWNTLAQQVMVMDVDRMPADDTYQANLDSWAGYRAPRRRLLDHLRTRADRNVVILTGDEHQNYAGNVHLKGLDTDSPVVAAEFVATSITSGGDGGDLRPGAAEILARNTHLKLLNDQRGYAVCDVTPARWETAFRVVDRVTTPGGSVSTRATFAVEPGKPGIAGT